MCQLSSYLVTQLAIILTDIEEIARHLKLQTFLSPAAFRLAFMFLFCSNGRPSPIAWILLPAMLIKPALLS
jgi:hypothetical protein